MATVLHHFGVNTVAYVPHSVRTRRRERVIRPTASQFVRLLRHDAKRHFEANGFAFCATWPLAFGPSARSPDCATFERHSALPSCSRLGRTQGRGSDRGDALIEDRRGVGKGKARDGGFFEEKRSCYDGVGGWGDEKKVEKVKMPKCRNGEQRRRNPQMAQMSVEAMGGIRGVFW